MLPFPIPAFPFALCPAGTGAGQNQSGFTTLLQDLVEKFSGEGG